MRAVLILLFGSMACSSGQYQSQLALEAQMEREILALRQRNRLLREQLKGCNVTGPASALYSQLFQVYRGSTIDISRTGQITKLTFPVSDLFASDGFTVRDEMRLFLDVLATALASNPDYRVRIEGHTDDSQVPYTLRRMYPDNWMYAMGRAMRLMDTLVQDFGVEEARFSLSSGGEFAPRDENDTETGRARNRRIDVYLYPKGVAL